MTPRETMIRALRREPIQGRVPHFEIVFFPVMEAFGKVHPKYRSYYQWDQMSRAEQRLHLEDIADTYILTARRYHHAAIHLHPRRADPASAIELLEVVREKAGDEFFLLVHGDTTPAIPDGDTMMEFSVQMYEDPGRLHAITRKRVEEAVRFADALARHENLLDGFLLCSDYCFNQAPFFSGAQFDEFIGPYLEETIRAYHERGFFAIKHTDGNIMPILERLVACGPDALHSLDPQGGVSLAEVKRLCGDRVCLIGNVNCGILQTGTLEELEAEVRRSLREGMPGYGYIFSTSNCVFAGLELARYERMNQIWWEEGIYP